MTKQNWIGVGYSLILVTLVLSSIDIFQPQGLLSVLKIFIGLILFVVALLEIVAQLKNHSLRCRGLYPPANKATSNDVEALLKANEKLKAIQLYRKMHHVSLQEALSVINRIEIR